MQSVTVPAADHRKVPRSLCSVRRSFSAYSRLTPVHHAILFGLLLAVLAPAIARADAGPKPLEATVTVVGLHFTVSETAVDFGPLRYGDINKDALSTIPVTNSAFSVPAEFFISLANLNPGGSAYGADCDAVPTTAEWTAAGNTGPSIMNFRATGPGAPNKSVGSTPVVISSVQPADTTWNLSFRMNMPLSGTVAPGSVCTVKTVLTAIAAP